MAEECPRQRISDRHRFATAALFLCFLLATMLVTLGREDLSTIEDATPDYNGDVPVVEEPPDDGEQTEGVGPVKVIPEPDDGNVVLEEVQVAPVNGVTPVGAGVTHSVATVDQWNAAVSAAAPGDVIRLTATINSTLTYRGDLDGGTATGAHGTAQAPIVITADPGVWIDAGSYSTGNLAGLNVWYVNHVHVVGVNVRNAQYGIRCLICRGTAEAPLRIASNTVTQLGYVGIHVGGHLSTYAPSSHVVIESNSVSQTGKLVAAWGEGIYLGHGANEWVDVTSNITVRWNEVSYTTAEGIDIKPGTREIFVEENLLHHVAPIDGGSISAHYVHNKANPHPDQLDRVIVRANKIWNQNLNGASGASDAAIWVGHGGVEILDNLVWGFRTHFNTRGVRVRSPKTFGPHPVRIENNTFWTQRGWVADGSPNPTSSVNASGNRGPDGASVEVVVAAGEFVGPVPAIGSGGDADSGGGPGSGLVLLSEAQAAPPPAPPPSTPPTTIPPTTAAPAPTAPPAPANAPGPPPTPATPDIASPIPGPVPGPYVPTEESVGAPTGDVPGPESTPDPGSNPGAESSPLQTSAVDSLSWFGEGTPDVLAFADLGRLAASPETARLPGLPGLVASPLGAQAVGGLVDGGALDPLDDAAGELTSLDELGAPEVDPSTAGLDLTISGHRGPATDLGVVTAIALAMSAIALGYRAVAPAYR